MKNLLIALTLPLSLMLSAQAISSEPASCPSINSIQGVGLNNAMTIQFEDGDWGVVVNHQKYDTNDNWGFFISLEANSANEAYKKAVKGLSSLHFRGGPMNVYDDTWACMYVTNEGYIAAAMTPPPGDLKRFKF